MSTDENRSIVRRYYEEVVNTGDLARVAEFIAPGYVEEHDGVRHAVGIEGAREHGGAANLLGPLLEIGAVRIADPVEG